MAPEREPLVLDLTKVDLMKLFGISALTNSFQAQVWLEFTLHDGANSPTLSASGSVFPIGEDGKPTFQPSAGWYAAQIDCRNALNFKIVDTKVMNRGNDVIWAIRFEGTFTETFDLKEFPFDSQDLTIMINMNCRANGPLPVVFRSDSAKVTLSCTYVCPPAKEWEVSPVLRCKPFTLGEDYAEADRQFPAIGLTVRVKRKPFYHVLNLAVPMSLFSLIIVMQAMVTERASFAHRAQMTIMMVLTATTFKVAIAGKLPPVSYLTWIDRFTFANALIVVLMAIWSRMLSLSIIVAEDSDQSGLVDNTVCTVLASSWLLVHLYYMVRAWRHLARKVSEVKLVQGLVESQDKLISSARALIGISPPAAESAI